MGLRLGIDLDGVVADFNGGWIARYNDEFDAHIPTDAVQVWDGIHQLTHFPDMWAFWGWARDWGGGSMFRHLDTYADAVPAMQRLGRSGHAIVILTSKPGWAVHDTYAWIAEHRIPTREVHILEEKWLVPCDIYLDDAPHVVEAIHHHRPEAAMVRFVRPWNRRVPGVHDVESWSQYASLVDEQASGRGSRTP